jgi:hypothetical protein
MNTNIGDTVKVSGELFSDHPSMMGKKVSGIVTSIDTVDGIVYAFVYSERFGYCAPIMVGYSQ